MLCPFSWKHFHSCFLVYWCLLTITDDKSLLYWLASPKSNEALQYQDYVKVSMFGPAMGANLNTLDIHSSWITALKTKDSASETLVLWEKKISGSVPYILKLCLREKQNWAKNQISSTNKARIRLPASFYKHPSPTLTSIYPKSFIRPSTIDLVLIFPTSSQPLR